MIYERDERKLIGRINLKTDKKFLRDEQQF